MKIKEPGSAAKNKIFLGFWFVVFAAAILLVNWWMQLPVNSSQNLIGKVSEMEKHMTRLTSLHAVFLASSTKTGNLVSASETNIEEDSKQSVIAINELIHTIGNSGIVRRNKSISALLKDFSREVEAYNASFNNLVLITRERGNQHSGLILNWRDRSSRMLSANGGNDAHIHDMLTGLKQLEGEYMLGKDPKILEDISIIAEDVRNSLTEESMINIADLDAYIHNTGSLLSIEKRMNAGAQGIIPELEKSLRNMPVIYNTFREVLTKKAETFSRNWFIAKAVVILLIIASFVYLFVNVFSLLEPLSKIAAFCKRIAAGEFPEEKIEAGNIMDLKLITGFLTAHIESLKLKYTFLRSLNEDKLDAPLVTAGEHDLVGNELISLQKKISDTYESQKKNEHENAVRQYMNEGAAKFADILRQKNENMVVLGDSFIREIVKYLNAIQGGFFVLDDADKNDQVLRLVSAFAYNRKKYLDQTIKLGEGLIGTCAREKQYINLTDIPPGYISITSGLGDTPPNNLLLIPVLHENELLGVIEIASLKKFMDYEIEFSREVALNLGATLVNTRNNQRTAELLAKSQQQALEMAEQEEEMRQNMEELKATQEESGRREEEFRGIAEAITNALLVVEYDIEGKISNVNHAMCLFIGKDREEVLGKTHEEVFDGTIRTDSNFWEDLRSSGHAVYTETVRIGKKTFDLIEHFAKVSDRNDNTVKYINFATNGRARNS